MKNYKCGHCKYIGPCYSIAGSTLSAPFCVGCGKNDMLVEVENTPRREMLSPERIQANIDSFERDATGLKNIPYLCEIVEAAKCYVLMRKDFEKSFGDVLSGVFKQIEKEIKNEKNN